MKTRVTELLGMKYPIIQGGLAHIATGAFAASVSQAGAFGQITATSLAEPLELRHEVEVYRSLTNAPFGVNIAMGHRPIDEFLEIALELKPQAISLTGGNPAPYINPIKSAGIPVLVLVAGVRQAVKAESLGADAIIAVGYEGGGHLGKDDVGTMVLTRKVVEAVNVPVICSGGISDGFGFLAALSLGADGIEMGTRFLATAECPIHQSYKNALLESDENQTQVIGTSVGLPGRVLPGKLVEKILELESTNPSLEEMLPLIAGRNNRRGALEGDVDNGYVWGGQGVGLINDVPSVDELINRILSEAQLQYDRLRGFMGER